MQKLKFEYSTKNIPVPCKRSYKLQLIEKIEIKSNESDGKQFFRTPEKKKNNQQRYGLGSFKIPPPVKELAAFESELIELVKNIKFRKVNNQLQNQLKEDIKKINLQDKTLTFADKSSNIYRLTQEEYVKMRRNSRTSTYKKTNRNIKIRIDIKGKQIMENVEKEILDRMDINSKNACFITLKDHKENNPTVRLINPAENELGRISKAILDNINKRLYTSLNIN